MDESDYWIPRNLDAPPLFFMWPADTAFIAIFCLIFGGVLNMFILGVVMAVVITRAYAHLKEEGGRGLIMRVIFWYAPSDWLTKHAPSHVREYIGG